MIAVIDYGTGNTESVINVLKDLGQEYKITKNEIEIMRSDRVILPGVGEAAFVMKRLQLSNLINCIRIYKKPVLGICLGMQILTEFTEENNTNCLNIIPGKCLRYNDNELKVPHMGWNSVEILSDNPLFEGIESNSDFYYANSYYLPLSQNTIAASVYGSGFTAAVNYKNFWGVQFHPEKSGEKGIRLLTNFCGL